MHSTNNKAPLMLCGNAGTGKTKMIGSKLFSLPEEKYVSVNANFNYYTDARSLQTVMEGALEKKAGQKTKLRSSWNKTSSCVLHR